jgi:hypothetical protein
MPQMTGRFTDHFRIMSHGVEFASFHPIWRQKFESDAGIFENLQ